MANAASNFLEFDASPAALVLNPLNNDARIAIASDALKSDGNDGFEETVDIVENGFELAPADARLLSLLGILAEKQGNADEARQYYDQALALLPTEFQALFRTLLMDIRAADFGSAAGKTELIARRWPDQWGLIESYLPILVASDDGFSAVAENYLDTEPGRRKIFGSLVSQKSGLSPAYKLLFEWRDRGITDLAWETNRLTYALLADGQGRVAHNLFLQTLSDQQRKEAGYVFNGRFNLQLSGNPFDWSIKNQTGVSFQHVHEENRDRVANEPARLEIRFLGNPLQFKNVSQFLRLPAGRYEVSVSYSSHDLVTPKPIELTLECVEGSTRLAAIGIGQGSKDETIETANFTVPAANCDMARLQFENEFVALSWRNRFEGTIKLYEVKVVRLGG